MRSENWKIYPAIPDFYPAILEKYGKYFFRVRQNEAAYRAVSDAIELAPDDNVAVLFGSYIHELYHAYHRLGASIAGKTRQRRRAESG